MIFDPDTIDDRTTYTEPARGPSGIDYVFVNGTLVVDHGRFEEGELAGQVLRRGGGGS